MKKLNFMVCILFSFLLFCSSDQLAGSKGGSETTNGITACVIRSNGTPAAGCLVRMRKADYFKAPTALAKISIDNTNNTNDITDSLGRFKIEGIDSGSYTIEVLDSFAMLNGGGTSVLFAVALDSNDTVNLGTGLLRPFASLKGKIDSTESHGSQLYAQVKGLEHIAKVDSTGEFAFYDLPQGYLDVRIVYDLSVVKKEILNIETVSADTTSLKISGSSLYCGYLYFDASSSGISSSSPVTNFPLLVKLDSTFNFNQANLLGSDISFHKLDDKSLPFEIEQWDSVSKKGAVWVRIDTIHSAHTEQCIVMKWGGASGTYESNSTAVFDTAAGFAGVWHLNEDPSTGAFSIKDRTVNQYNGTPANSMTKESSVPAVIGTGIMFNGINDSIDAGQLNLSGSYSLSCWANLSKGQNSNWRLIMNQASYTLWYDTKLGGVRAEHINASGWRGLYQDSPDSVPKPLNLGSWYYLVSTFDGDKIRLYVNGAILDSTNSIGAISGSSNSVVFFGGRINEFFYGVMDEVRIERRARSAEWIKLSYLNQNPQTVFVKYRKQ